MLNINRTLILIMTYKRPIGVGGVVTAYALTIQSHGIKLEEGLEKTLLLQELLKRHQVGMERCLRAVELAKICGVLREESTKVYIQGRPD